MKLDLTGGTDKHLVTSGGRMGYSCSSDSPHIQGEVHKNQTLLEFKSCHPRPIPPFVTVYFSVDILSGHGKQGHHSNHTVESPQFPPPPPRAHQLFLLLQRYSFKATGWFITTTSPWSVLYRNDTRSAEAELRV